METKPTPSVKPLEDLVLIKELERLDAFLKNPMSVAIKYDMDNPFEEGQRLVERAKKRYDEILDQLNWII